jgi:hypothetical protein
MTMADDWFVPGEQVAPASGGVDDWIVPGKSATPPRDVSSGMALRGIPVIGAYIPQVEAALNALAHPLSGVGEPGANFSERYAANLPKRQAEYEQAEKDSPISSELLKLGGGAAALAPLGATALGARALGAAGSLPARLGFGAASGAGISAADALARGEDPGQAALVGGGVGLALPAAGAAIGRIGRTARGYMGAPAADDLAPAVDAGYAALRNSGLEIKPQAVQSAINQIRINQQIHPKLTPDVSSLLEDAATKGIMSPLTGARAGVKFDDIDTLRKHLGQVARNYTNPTEQEAARGAIRGLDDYLAKINPADVLSGDAKQVAALAKETRGNAAAEFRLRAMDSLRQRAEDQAAKSNSGLNVENAYRQQLASFVRPNNKGVSPATKEGFTQEEIDQIRAATRGTSFPNMLRLVGNMLGGGHGLMAGAGIAGSIATGDPRYAAAVGLGYGSRQLSNSMMRNRAEMLSRMTSARSPLAQQMGTGGPVGPALNLGGAQGAITGALPTVNSALPDDFNPLKEIPGRAQGGPVQADRPYVVGEDGPEIVVPRQNGTVLPQRLANPMRDFADAAQAAHGSPNARNLSRLTIASRNLSNNLKDANIHIAPNEILKSLFGKK